MAPRNGRTEGGSRRIAATTALSPGHCGSRANHTGVVLPSVNNSVDNSVHSCERALWTTLTSPAG